jgi:hypothetical protein
MIILKLSTWHLWKFFKYNNNYFKELTTEQNNNLNIFFKIILYNVCEFKKDQHRENFDNLLGQILPSENKGPYYTHNKLYQAIKNLKYIILNNKNILSKINVNNNLLKCMLMCIKHIDKKYKSYKIITN